MGQTRAWRYEDAARVQCGNALDTDLVVFVDDVLAAQVPKVLQATRPTSAQPHVWVDNQQTAGARSKEVAAH